MTAKASTHMFSYGHTPLSLFLTNCYVMVRGSWTANNNVFGWDDINVSVPSRRGGPAVTLLHGISGTATSGQMVALVGR